MKTRWNQKEIDLLIKSYPIKHKEELLKIFPNRTYHALQAKAERLDIKSTVRYWTSEDIEYLKKEYPCKTREELVKKFNRSWDCIREKAMLSSIKRPRFINKNFAPPRSKYRNTLRRYFIKKLGHYCHYPNCTWKETVEINHIDGNRLNYIESNIEILCPNHHSITPTHAHQGHRYYKKY